MGNMVGLMLDIKSNFIVSHSNISCYEMIWLTSNTDLSREEDYYYLDAPYIQYYTQRYICIFLF